VGSFEPDEALELTARYFGRLPVGTESPPTQPVIQPPAGGRWETFCACPTQVRVLYRSPALGDADTPPLQLLAALLNGRSGRLYRALVLEQEIAFSASAQQTPLAHSGVFEVAIEAKGGIPAEALLAAWDRELATLLAQPLPEGELQRARNQLLVGSLRQLRQPDELLRRLLIYDALDGWERLVAWPDRVLELEGEDVQTAARTHLRSDTRWVAFLHRQR
jgi:predicted Zn-dependent peptidase